jgi:hypothetical protein
MCRASIYGGMLGEKVERIHRPKRVNNQFSLGSEA